MARPRRISEFAAIAQLRALFRDSSSRTEVGIGDDAAVLKASGRLVWTVDTAVEHVHFERAWLSLADIGWRSFQAAASDVCAMGGAPVAALSSVIFPRDLSTTELLQLARGQRAAARALGCSIVGGNLSIGSELSVTTTLIGDAKRPLLRSAAKAGDELWLCGDVGLAAAGLRCLQRSGANRNAAWAARALRAFRRPHAQLAAGLSLVRRAHAAIDVSDGLAGDAAHLAHDSGARLILDLRKLETALAPALLKVAAKLELSALQLALYGGEDYALLAAGPGARRPGAARVIGRVERGSGVWLLEGARLTRAARGFEHSGGRKARRVGR
jgi:thiamine-monophosphate kinase